MPRARWASGDWWAEGRGGICFVGKIGVEVDVGIGAGIEGEERLEVLRRSCGREDRGVSCGSCCDGSGGVCESIAVLRAS